MDLEIMNNNSGPSLKKRRRREEGKSLKKKKKSDEKKRTASFLLADWLCFALANSAAALLPFVFPFRSLV
jgi:uncharacterized protein YqiB (DUF1249 family)|tara:strand:+ start:390 stop:599 length:210 start_codon:yes stop_codon:yes gene_type:complete